MIQFGISKTSRRNWVRPSGTSTFKRRENMATQLQEIKNAIKEKKLVIGLNSVRRGTKSGLLKTIYSSSNCPEPLIKDIDHYAKLSNIGFEKFNGTSVQLGEICGKPFNILLIAVRK